MATTKLRLLRDELIPEELALAIEKHKKINVERVVGIASLRGKDDPDLVAYAKRQRRIIVTAETRFSEHQYPICTHPGIIVVRHRSHESSLAALFDELIRSGLRKQCKHAVTYLRQDSISFLRQADDGQIEETVVPLRRSRRS